MVLCEEKGDARSLCFQEDLRRSMGVSGFK